MPENALFMSKSHVISFFNLSGGLVFPGYKPHMKLFLWKGPSLGEANAI